MLKFTGKRGKMRYIHCLITTLKNENHWYEKDSLVQFLLNGLAAQWLHQKKRVNRLQKVLFEYTRQPVQMVFGLKLIIDHLKFIKIRFKARDYIGYIVKENLFIPFGREVFDR